MQPRRGAGKPTDVDDSREGTQMTQVHSAAYNNSASLTERQMHWTQFATRV
jgi:hypothetical protein